MIWIALLVMAAVAAAVLIVPLLRARRAALPRAAYDLEVYRDQLSELERDQARGLIGDAETKAARAEIARRMLAAAGETAAPDDAKPASRALPLALAAIAPVVALALYVGLGSPGMPSLPFAERAAEATDPSRQEITRMVSSLAEKLQKNPDDLDGWVLLARSLTSLERYSDAIPAWRRVMQLSNNAVEHASSFAEALVQAANGIVTPEARGEFERVLKANPLDPRARFYIGLAQAQAGESRDALQTWTDLVALSPPDAPWLATVRERIRQAAAQARIDPATVTPSPDALRAAEEARKTAPRGPSAADVEAAQRMSPEERMKMIRGMVDSLEVRLKAEPNDVEGWRRLGRAQRVLGDHEKAKAALAKAAALAPERVDMLSDYASVLLDGASGETLPPDFVAVMRRVLALDPKHGDALWFVGLAEAQAGHRDQAAALWQKLLAQLPPDSREHAEIKQRLDQLKAKN